MESAGGLEDDAIYNDWARQASRALMPAVVLENFLAYGDRTGNAG